MNNRWKLAFSLAIAAFAVPGSAAPVPSNAWTGTWRLDVAHSKFSGPAPRQEVRDVRVTPRRFSVQSHGVGATGKELHFNYSVALDGRFYPLVGNPDGDRIAVRLTSPHRITIQVRRRHTLAATAITTVSGNRMTMDRRRRAVSGSPSEDILVYERVR